MAAMLPFKPVLSLVGVRRYVLGADLFREFERGSRDGLTGAATPTLVRSFKLHSEITHDGEWRSGVLEGAAAEIAWLDRTGSQQHASFVESDRPIETRVPDPAPRLDRVEHDLAFGGKAVAPAPQNTAELLHALVEGNKSNHVATLRARSAPHDRIRFIYVENLPWIAEPEREPWPLEYVARATRPAADRTYTLTDVRCPRASAPIRICYSHGH